MTSPLLAAGSATVTSDLVALFWIVLAAWLAPILSSFTRSLVPGVVFLLALGAALGPHALGLASETPGVALISELGLGLLFLLAGVELSTSAMLGRRGRLAAATWVGSVVLAVGVGWLVAGRWDSAVAIGLILTSTAVGTLLPILKGAGHDRTPAGRAVVTHGAVGELGPVLAMALLLGTNSILSAVVALAMFLLAALLVLLVPPRLLRLPGVARGLREGATSTSQSGMRTVMVLLAAMMLVAAWFKLDVVLGAFAAGIMLRHIVDGLEGRRGHADDPPEGGLAHMLVGQLETVGYTVFIPVFFVVSGMAVDIGAVVDSPWLLPAVVASILVLRGGGVWLGETLWRVNPGLDRTRDRARVGLYAAAGLPIIVAVTDVAVDNDLMDADTASVLVAAGAVTVLLFPLIAQLLAPPRSVGGRELRDDVFG